MTTACDAGDADACEAIDRRIDPAKLCAAYDYEACSLLGCAGDEAAAALADAHRVDVRCDRTVPAPVATAITPAARPPFDSIEFHPLGGGLRHDRTPRYEVYNVSTRTVVMVFGSIYAYDAAGNQVARNTFELRRVSLRLVRHHPRGWWPRRRLARGLRGSHPVRRRTRPAYRAVPGSQGEGSEMALPDQAIADATRAYATWLLTDAQAIFDRLGYGREPESVTRAALTRLTVAKPTN